MNKAVSSMNSGNSVNSRSMRMARIAARFDDFQIKRGGLQATARRQLTDKLPEQKLSVMDRNLDPVSIEHFVQSLATKVARAARL